MQEITALLESPYYNIIEPNLYIGAIEALSNEEFMSMIEAVVSLTSGTRDLTLVGARSHLNITVSDNDDAAISVHFEECYAFIQEKLNSGKKVLVHCVKGRSRSATIVAYYLMKSYQMSALEALQTIKTQRPCIRPNDNFIEQLLDLPLSSP